MAELRINTTGKLSLFDADDSHAASIVAGTVTANENVMSLATAGVTFNVPTITLGDATAEDTKLVFDGNAQDFYVGLDDSADDLIIGLGSTVGTTPAITVNEDLQTTIANHKNPKAPFRNLIINGDMHVRQRADTSIHNNGVVKPCDMWQQWGSAMDNIAGTLAIDSSVPTGYGFSGSLRYDTTTVESALAADEYQALVTHVEARNAHHLAYGTASAKATTLSWWSRSNLNGTSADFVVNVKAPDGSREITKSFYHGAADTWEKFTMAIPGDASGTINDDNGQGFEIKWILSAGSNFTSADSTSWGAVATGGFAYGISGNITGNTANDFYITGVQLEVGDVESDYEYLPFDVQLQRCMRYYTRYDASAGYTRYASGFVNSTTAAVATMQLPVPMRGVPTLETSGTAGDYSIYHGDGTTACNSTPTIQVPSTGDNNATSVGLQQDVASGLTAGEGCIFLGTNANTDNFFAFSSEL